MIRSRRYVNRAKHAPKKVKKLEYQKFFGQIGEPHGQLGESFVTVIYLDMPEMEILSKSLEISMLTRNFWRINYDTARI